MRWPTGLLLTPLLLAGLTGCGDAPGELSFALFVASDDGTEVEVGEGGVLPWVYGFQGGTMVRPLLVFSGGVARYDQVEVVLRHDVDPAAPGALGEAEEFPELVVSAVVREDADGRLLAGPFDDQVGWTDLSGMRFIFSAEARANGAVASAQAAVTLETPPPPDTVCNDYGGPFAPTGCEYARFPGTLTVMSVEAPPAGEPSCAEGRAVFLTFTHGDPEAAAACVATLQWEPDEGSIIRVSGGRHPPASCLEAAGLVLGASFPADISVLAQGTCSPGGTPEADIDLSGCESACM